MCEGGADARPPDARSDAPRATLTAIVGCTRRTGVDLLKKCVDEVQSRLVVAPAAFQLTAIDKDGVRRIAMYPEIEG